ncbi:histidinol-phosphate aminotransferase [Sporolactobacillus inulinus]|uniref:Histidinol-phosphate aminotransferase n=1 Tax=Sporolactobacillus inulinus TaxID=2078 RepID=A0A4Y1Z8M6_9BACL|nr:histidinol-phosphate aminotransferase [Sporolactobacillus inulinus]
MSSYWNQFAQKLDPYVPGEQPKDKKYVKLNTNENPYPPSPRVLTAISEAVNDQLRLYPDPTCDALRQKSRIILNSIPIRSLSATVLMKSLPSAS